MRRRDLIFMAGMLRERARGRNKTARRRGVSTNGTARRSTPRAALMRTLQYHNTSGTQAVRKKGAPRAARRPSGSLAAGPWFAQIARLRSNTVPEARLSLRFYASVSNPG
jgi:hypothetical protein